MARITDDLEIPEGELVVVADRSSGPGGQHVNKVSTRVTIRFDVARSPSLSDEQRRRITERAGSRLTQDGILQVRAQDSRSQKMNRDLALERLVAILGRALSETKGRRRTRVPARTREERLRSKRKQASIKSLRREINRGSDE